MQSLGFCATTALPIWGRKFETLPAPIFARSFCRILSPAELPSRLAAFRTAEARVRILAVGTQGPAAAEAASLRSTQGRFGIEPDDRTDETARDAAETARPFFADACRRRDDVGRSRWRYGPEQEDRDLFGPRLRGARDRVAGRCRRTGLAPAGIRSSRARARNRYAYR